MKLLSALIAGLLFGAGLAASGMTDTAKVIGFLNIFGAWDPDLVFVMGAALVTTFVGYRLIFVGRSQPLFAEKYFLPQNTMIDHKLILGATLFGIGWGLFGYCPGPAIAALAYLNPTTGLFVVAMLVGMFIGSRLEPRFS